MKYVALMLASYVLKQARINIDVDNRLCIVPIFFFFFFFFFLLITGFKMHYKYETSSVHIKGSVRGKKQFTRTL